MNKNRKVFPLTVEKLYSMCKEEINKGNGYKYIAMSNDDEGNGYHDLFYGFEHVSNYNVDYGQSFPEDRDTFLKEYIILG